MVRIPFYREGTAFSGVRRPIAIVGAGWALTVPVALTVLTAFLSNPAKLWFSI